MKLSILVLLGILTLSLFTFQLKTVYASTTVRSYATTHDSGGGWLNDGGGAPDNILGDDDNLLVFRTSSGNTKHFLNVTFDLTSIPETSILDKVVLGFMGNKTLALGSCSFTVEMLWEMVTSGSVEGNIAGNMYWQSLDMHVWSDVTHWRTGNFTASVIHKGAGLLTNTAKADACYIEITYHAPVSAYGFSGITSLTYVVNGLKTIVFTRNSNIPLAFTIDGTTTFRRALAFVGTTLLQFTVNMEKALSSLFHGTSILTFTVDTTPKLIQNILTFFGLAQINFQAVASTVTTSILDNTVAFVGLLVVGLIVGFSCFMLYRRKED
jgi:hypothetical protein